MIQNPTDYFSRKKVVNFDIINHEYRGDKLQGSYKEYQTIKKDDFKKFPENEKKKTLLLVL